jgi:hypothetical protein
MVEMLDYRLHYAVLATEQRVQRLRDSRDGRGSRLARQGRNAATPANRPAVTTP